MAPKILKEGSRREGEIAEKTQEVKVYWRRILERNRMNWNLEVLDKEED